MDDWRTQWFEFDDAVYLNTSAEGLMPRVAVQAARQAVDAKTFPHRVAPSTFFEVPDRLRASIASLIGGRPEEVALTTGASAGAAILAHGLPWKAGDEVITATGEFPLQYTTWSPLAEREGVRLRAVAPAGAFLAADDLIAALSPRTRLVSVSLVRFDDGSMLDTARLAAACHAQGTLLLLDVSQCCGAMPIDVASLGADFLTAAGYKWLLSPYGTGSSGAGSSTSRRCGRGRSTGWPPKALATSAPSRSPTRSRPRARAGGTRRSGQGRGTCTWQRWPRRSRSWSALARRP